MNLAQEAREATGYTQRHFCKIFLIKLGNQRNYEQGLVAPPYTTDIYLKLIKAHPRKVERMLKDI